MGLGACEDRVGNVKGLEQTRIASFYKKFKGSPVFTPWRLSSEGWCGILLLAGKNAAQSSPMTEK